MLNHNKLLEAPYYAHLFLHSIETTFMSFMLLFYAKYVSHKWIQKRAINTTVNV